MGDDGQRPPDPAEVRRALGLSHDAFDRLASLRPTVAPEWRRYTRAGPWTLKVVEGRRTLYYLTPGEGEFHVSIVLGERATAAALSADDIPESLKTALREARPYAEGRGVRVPVRDLADLPPIERLLAIKLDPT